MVREAMPRRRYEALSLLPKADGSEDMAQGVLSVNVFRCGVCARTSFLEVTHVTVTPGKGKNDQPVTTTTMVLEKMAVPPSVAEDVLRAGAPSPAASESAGAVPEDGPDAHSHGEENNHG